MNLFFGALGGRLARARRSRLLHLEFLDDGLFEALLGLLGLVLGLVVLRLVLHREFVHAEVGSARARLVLVFLDRVTVFAALRKPRAVILRRE